jgi:hypothetical protein
MSVTFTASTLGPTASSFTLTSSSGVTGSGASSPLTLQEVVVGTYTYSVSGTNANGTGPSSAASNSVVVASVVSPSYDSIATTTLSSSASSITFSSIPATYTHLQIRGNVLATNDCVVGVQFNSDTGANYSSHVLRGDGTTAGVGNEANGSRTYFGYNYVASGYSASVALAAIVDILDYTNTNKYKTMRALAGIDYNGSGKIHYESGNWRNTNAITSITLTAFSSQTFNTKTTFALYGIKGA